MIQSYISKIEISERILQQQGDGGLSYEVGQLRQRLERLEDDVNNELSGKNDSTGRQNLLA